MGSELLPRGLVVGLQLFALPRPDALSPLPPDGCCGAPIPEAEQDKTLPETLRSELPGILAWIVRGCIEYLRDGLGEPEQVMDATKVYRTDMDPLEAFIDEECVVRPEAWCKFAKLYSAYTRWCEESNEYPIKKRRFADRLTERGYERDVGTDGVKIRRGIALHHDGDPDPS